MANLTIAASVADLSGAAPKNFTFFKDEDKKTIVAAPTVENGTATWTIPDTPENRNLFKRNFGDSGPFRLETEGSPPAEPPAPKTPAPKTPAPKTPAPKTPAPKSKAG